MKITRDLLKAVGVCHDGYVFALGVFKDINADEFTHTQGKNSLQSYMLTNPNQTELKMEWWDSLKFNPVAVKFYNDYTRGTYGFQYFESATQPIYITGEDGSVEEAAWSHVSAVYQEYATLEEATDARLAHLNNYMINNPELFNISQEVPALHHDGSTASLYQPISQSDFLIEQTNSKYQILNPLTAEVILLASFTEASQYLTNLKSQFLDAKSPIKQKVTNPDGDYAWDNPTA